MTDDQLRRRAYEKNLGLRPNETTQGIDIPVANPGIGWTWIIDMLIRVLAIIVPAISPEIREELDRWLLGFYQRSMETSNPWDDFLARFLLRIFQIPIPA